VLALLASSLLLVAGVAIVLRSAQGIARVVVALVMTAVAALGLLGRRTHARDKTGEPATTPAGEYVSSAACRSCHPAEYGSWHRTFHRTMTQEATSASVAAPLPSTPLELGGRRYELRLRGDDVWATLPDLDALADAESGGSRVVPTVERRLLLATGSHHYQGYWVAGRRAGELRMFPFVYVFAEGRWLPRADVFLQRPGAQPNLVRWNSNCIACHATAGQPRHDLEADRFDTEVAELGVACEACHGPGGEHVRRSRDPLGRYVAYAKDSPDPSIVNPARLPADRASMICGQCHAYSYPRDDDEWWTRGDTRTYRPGLDLAPARVLITYEPHLASPTIDASLGSLFWPDGAIRVGGREYNGLVESPCFVHGEGKMRLSCLSCHSMHASDPDDQLVRGLPGNEACLQCHEDMRARLVAHTHHAAGSSGSLCANCHMPMTTYALLKAIRSHRIDSPRAASALASGRPLACTLCHLDKSLGWAAGRLAAWYGAGLPGLALRDETEPTVVGLLLRGDAAQRVIAAASMGWHDAHATSGNAWEAPFVAQLLEDPYSAVRIVAARALRTLPGFEDFAYDPMARPEERARARREVVLAWERTSGRPFESAWAAGVIAERDDHAVTIAE
jgi:predicted CXXCH cytochrome family protein